MGLSLAFEMMMSNSGSLSWFRARAPGRPPALGWRVAASRFAPEGGALLFFHFELDTPSGRRYTADGPDGEVLLASQFSGERQLTVYERVYQTPEWFAGGVLYQIFPDRFAVGKGGILRAPGTPYNEDWRHGIPEYPAVAGQSYPNDTHFGGNLYGAAEKLDYLQALGVTALYLNPVCRAFSNHKYDTGDYLAVDARFGGDDALRALVREAHARGMRVILDGVFNHVGDDSVYFNRYGRYPSVGAYQSKESPYAEWFHFTAFPEEYDCWWGMKNLPKLVKCASLLDFICSRVIPKYMELGVDGWRLDVVDELDGESLERIVRAVRAYKPDALILGEVWEDVSNKTAYGERKRYFQGRQLDGATNYPLRNGILDFILQRESAPLLRTLRTLYRHYPPHCLRQMMNVLGTHDTERVLTVLSGEELPEDNTALSRFRLSPEGRARALRRLRCAYLLLAALPGVPCIYYGDEAGLEGGRDPFNRRPFPWEDADRALTAFFARVNALRREEPLFCAAELAFHPADGESLLLERRGESGSLLIAANMGVAPKTLPLPAYVQNVVDILSERRYNDNVPLESEQVLLLKNQSCKTDRGSGKT